MVTVPTAHNLPEEITATRQWSFLLPHHQHVLLKFIIEAHEGVATYRCLHRALGIIEISTPLSQERTARSLVEALSKELSLQELSAEEVRQLMNGEGNHVTAPR
jgi:predicted neuraminidase